MITNDNRWSYCPENVTKLKHMLDRCNPDCNYKVWNSVVRSIKTLVIENNWNDAELKEIVINWCKKAKQDKNSWHKNPITKLKQLNHFWNNPRIKGVKPIHIESFEFYYETYFRQNTIDYDKELDIPKNPVYETIQQEIKNRPKVQEYKPNREYKALHEIMYTLSRLGKFFNIKNTYSTYGRDKDFILISELKDIVSMMSQSNPNKYVEVSFADINKFMSRVYKTSFKKGTRKFWINNKQKKREGFKLLSLSKFAQEVKNTFHLDNFDIPHIESSTDKLLNNISSANSEVNGTKNDSHNDLEKIKSKIEYTKEIMDMTLDKLYEELKIKQNQNT